MFAEHGVFIDPFGELVTRLKNAMEMQVIWQCVINI